MDLKPLHTICSQHAGYYDLKTLFSLTLISGEDRVSFLQSLLTNDVEQVSKEKVIGVALLNRKGQILAEGYLFEYDSKTIAWLHSKEQVSLIKDLLEEFIFAEDVSIQSSLIDILLLFGQEAKSILDLVHLEGIKTPLFAEENFLILPSSKSQFQNYLQQKHLTELPEIPTKLFHVFRIENGTPFFTNDLKDRLFNDTSLVDTHLNTQKGCYPGQEIVTRISQRGQSAWQFIALRTEKDPHYRPPMELTEETKTVYKITSFCKDPNSQSLLILGYGRRSVFKYCKKIELVQNRRKQEYTLSSLPFRLPKYRGDLAQRAYERGIDHFHRNQFVAAKESLNLALEVLPTFADAYEALGMIAEKEGQIEVAIKHNLNFAHFLPEAVMAHTNLSRLYMLKGWIEKAELKQQEAQELYFRLNQQGSPSATLTKEAIEKQNQILAAERQKKENLFKSVLEIDPEDEIALFGLGKAYADRNEFPTALHFLEKLLEINPDYSAAWPLLIKSLIGEEKYELAIELAEKGKKVCLAKGDLMPGKLIDVFLKKIPQ